MLAWQRKIRLLALTLLFSVAHRVPAQPPLIGPLLPQAASIAPEKTAEPPVDQRAQENAEQLRIALRKLEAVGPTNGAAAQAVARFQTKGAIISQQQAVERQINDLEVRKLALENQLLKPATTDESTATCSFVEFDALKDELAAERARANLVADKLAAAKAAVEKAQRALDECGVKQRQAIEAFDKGQESAQAADLAASADEARQAAELAAETLALRKREIAREQLAEEVQRLAVRICQEKITRLSALVAFSEADYQAQMSDITKKENSANKSLARAQGNLPEVDMQIQEAQKQHDAETGDRTVLAERLEAQRKTRDKTSDEIESLTQRLQQLAELRVAWNRRYQIATASMFADKQLAWDELKIWQKGTTAALDDLAGELRTQILRMRDLRSSLTSITKKADAAKDGPVELHNWLETQKGQVEAMLRIREKDLVTIETSRRVHEKLLEEIGLGVQTLTPTNLALGAWHQARQVWNQEITTIDGRSITIGKVVTALTVFIGGWILARILSVVFANRILKRFRLSRDATAALRTLVFYAMMAVVLLHTLRTIGVSLTAFTVLGGALAIGVGFGSQALINNFIGGLIMLAERPVRLGERIIFGSFDGVVEDVGFRCTKLRTATDHLITIPNSTLVNDSIENAARRRTIRRQLNIPVAIDTPRDRLAAAVQAIRDILGEKDIRERIHPIVGFEELPPRVYFNEFRTDGFNIQIMYWYAPPAHWEFMDHSERVNLRIMEEFDRLGVQFASPPKAIQTITIADRELAA